MSSRKVVIFSAILFLLFSCPALAWKARVVHVADGDTVHVEPLDGGERVKIRLYGIDAPESKQTYGSVATGFVFDAVLYKTVEVTQYDTDRYGRSVAEIQLSDDGRTSLNRELVRLGHAWVYTSYCKESFCDEWKELEQRARTEGRGLWGSGAAGDEAIAPWEWRKEQKKK